MKNFAVLVFTFLFLGCASEPVGVQYYFLHVPNELQASAPSSNHLKKTIIFNKIKVAEYLKPSSLVMQIDEHELYYSKQDLWAEPVQSSLYKSLLHELNRSEKLHYAPFTSPKAMKGELVLSVQIEHFHITNQSTAISTGYYWLTTKNGTTPSKNILLAGTPFYYELRLEQDGFGHAVKKLRATVEKIAEKINQDVANLNIINGSI